MFLIYSYIAKLQFFMGDGLQILFPPGFDPRFIQPVACRYTTVPFGSTGREVSNYWRVFLGYGK
jgi:hypothetical protein